jgi:hypothetical protein
MELYIYQMTLPKNKKGDIVGVQGSVQCVTEKLLQIKNS